MSLFQWGRGILKHDIKPIMGKLLATQIRKVCFMLLLHLIEDSSDGMIACLEEISDIATISGDKCGT